MEDFQDQNVKPHFIKEYLLEAALKKAGIKSVNTPYTDARLLANSMAKKLGESNRISDRTLVRCFEDKEKWTDTWGYLAAFVLDKGKAFKDLEPGDKTNRSFLLRNCLEEYKVLLEKDIQRSRQFGANKEAVSSTGQKKSRRNLVKNGLFLGLGMTLGVSGYASFNYLTKNRALPTLNLLVNSHPGNALLWKYIRQWTKKIQENSNGRIIVVPRVLEPSEMERKESLLQRLILGKDFQERSFDLYLSVNYHDEPDNSSLNFYGSIPFGMTSEEFNAWYQMEGRQLLSAYKDAYKTFLFGNSGQQLGGWYLKQVEEPDDLQNMIIRMHGLGANVLQRTINNVSIFRTFLDAEGFVRKIKEQGGSPANYAIEYINAYTDQQLGYPKLLKELARQGISHKELILYEKGWHERGTTWTIKMNRNIYESIKKHESLLKVFVNTTREIHLQISYEFEKQGRQLLRKWKGEDTPFRIRKFKRSLGHQFLQKTAIILNEKYRENKIYNSYADFHKEWSGIDLKNGEIMDEHVWEELFEKE